MQDDFSSNNSRAIQIEKELANQEIERLKADYDAALMAIHSLKSQIDELNEKIVFNEPLYSRRQLQAQNARYREALRDVRSEMTRSESQINHGWCIDVICEALKEE